MDRFWSNGSARLSVFFYESSEEHRPFSALAIQIVQEYTKHGNVVIEQVFTEQAANVRVQYGNENWSLVGRECELKKTGKTMSLSLRDARTGGNLFRSRVLHEFGHALGFEHEHQVRSVEWNAGPLEEAHNKMLKGHFVSEVLKQKRYKHFSEFSEGAIDFESIMTYDFPAGSASQGEFHLVHELSQGDIQRIQRVYPKPQLMQLRSV